MIDKWELKCLALGSERYMAFCDVVIWIVVLGVVRVRVWVGSALLLWSFDPVNRSITAMNNMFNGRIIDV
jgi:hypothetical protein